MNDPIDPLEDTLRQFHPKSVSAAKRQQVAEQITATRTRAARTRAARTKWLVTTSLGAVAAAVAVCLLAAMFFYTDSPAPEVHSDAVAGSSSHDEHHDAVPEQNDRVQVADATAHSEQPAPTLWAYRRAADGSWEELDSLLARHAQELLTPEQGSIASLQRR